MAKKNSSTPPKQRKRSVFGLILSPVGMLMTVIIYLVISIVVSTVIEWVGMGTGYWDKHHSRDVLVQELAYLGDNFSMTIFGVSAESAAKVVITYLQNLFSDFSTLSRGQNKMWITLQLHKLGSEFQPYLNAFIYVTMVTAVRCIIILLSSVLFILVGIAAAVDGLHLRELRKVGGGVEHASIYHHAKSWVPLAVLTSPVIYLAWPGAINPNFILLPGMAVYFLAVLMTFSTFKKHL